MTPPIWIQWIIAGFLACLVVAATVWYVVSSVRRVLGLLKEK